jgi:outer membrane protein OmpA-like peptidoglycan-associated protein
MYKSFTFLFVLFTSIATPCKYSAQSCPAPEDVSSKTMSLFEKATDKKKKKTTEERIEILKEVVDRQNDFGAAYEALVGLLFKQAKKDREVSGECIAATAIWIELCGDQSEAHYILGALAFISGDASSALVEFEKFIAQTDEEAENEMLSKRTVRKRRDVMEMIPEARFEVQYYSNRNAYKPEPLLYTSQTEDEYLPALSPDGSILFFTRARNERFRGDVITRRVEDFVWSKRKSAEEEFDRGELLSYPFNDGGNFGGVSLSIDNRLLVVAASNPTPNNPENIDLFTTTYIVNGKNDTGGFSYYWGDLKLLGPEINTPMGWESQPALSAEGDELFFASARKNSTLDDDGNPTMDIYVSIKDENGHWSLAEKLPYPISTSAQEKAPFIHPDGKTLYFSSTRLPSGGGYDLWVSRRDSMNVWSEPVNLGMPVNTTGDEHGLVVSSNGNEAYFASRRNGTKGLDILSFPLPNELKPEAVKVIHGVVDPTPPSDDIRLTIEYVQSRQVEEIDLNLDDGSFAAVINLERNEDVILNVSGVDLEFEATVVHVAQEDKENEEHETPSQEPTPSITVRAKKSNQIDAFELKDVQFETNKSELTYTTKLILRKFAEYILANPKYSMQIEGHTDDVGSTEDNLKLSQARAEAVKKFFEESGIESSRLQASGFGEANPKGSNNTDQGRASNRRTEFILKNNP